MGASSGSPLQNEERPRMPWAGASRPWRPPKSCSDGVAQHVSISLAADANLRLRRSRQSDPGRYGPNKGKPQVLRAYQGAGAGRAQVGLAPRTRPPGQTLQRAPAFAPAGELCRAKTIKT